MINSKKINIITIVLVTVVFIAAICIMMLPGDVLSGRIIGNVSYSEQHTVSYSDDDYYSSYGDDISKITLEGTTASAGSKNVSVEENEITILGGGTYVVSGELTGGSIIVDSGDGAEVRLVLNGVSVTSSDFAALYIKQSAKTVISLVEGTENTFTDASDYNEEKLEEEKPTAAVYCKDDLTINGSGSLVVNGNYRDGIKVNDNLKMTEGTLKVTAADDGVNVNDYVVFLNTEVEIISVGDGIKCENESLDKGFIVLDETTLNITSGGDGVYASSSVYANDVTSQITTGGGSANVKSSQGGMERTGGGFGFENKQSKNAVSAKGVKAGYEIVIKGGSYILDNSDDSIHSDGNVTVIGGVFNISTGDDAIHADKYLTLETETVNVSKCREGIEGAYITINSGDISIISSDDSINAVGENSSDSMHMGMYGGAAKTEESDIYLEVNGGNIHIETSGDGIDSNGSARINGGSVVVYGPENDGNGSIDVGDGGYVLLINGGSLLVAGSSGMAESPTDSSEQNSISFYLDQNYEAGSTIAVVDSGKNEIISGTPNKKFNFICVSSASLTEGENYTLVVNGNEIASITAEGTVTTSGNRSRFGGRGGMGNDRK